uniref:ribose-phosphate pyrophosphokinase-like domain-containing protein n=1 Tax=Candidatus Ventrenecus sp. TaxID=3085654 RepID=UPI003FEF5F91
MNELKMVCMDNIHELGQKVDRYLKKKYNSSQSYLVVFKRYRFNNGEGKFTFLESIRDNEVFILSDISNYSVTYQMHGHEVMM